MKQTFIYCFKLSWQSVKTQFLSHCLMRSLQKWWLDFNLSILVFWICYQLRFDLCFLVFIDLVPRDIIKECFGWSAQLKPSCNYHILLGLPITSIRYVLKNLFLGCSFHLGQFLQCKLRSGCRKKHHCRIWRWLEQR